MPHSIAPTASRGANRLFIVRYILSADIVIFYVVLRFQVSND